MTKTYTISLTETMRKGATITPEHIKKFYDGMEPDDEDFDEDGNLEQEVLMEIASDQNLIEELDCLGQGNWECEVS